METVFQDIRYALRQLSKAPAFAAAVIVILALGIGGTTAIFSVLNSVLLEPLPYPHARRLMGIWYADADGSRSPQAFHTYREIAERNRVFESVAVMKAWQPTLSGADHPERLEGQQVSAGYLHTLGIAPMLGRDFQSADDLPNAPLAAILSNGLWRRRFGGDRGIIGQQVRLDDQNYMIIAVLPPAFDNVLSSSAEVWSTLRYEAGNVASTETREWGQHLRMIGRLREGVSPEQARTNLAWIAHTPVPEFPRAPWASQPHGFVVNSLQDDLTSGVKPALLAVFGAVILVLLIACVNVTNLLLARRERRRGEFAMRSALGAGRSRLVRQLITESLLLAGLGGMLGMVIAQGGIRILVALSPPELPRLDAIRIDGTVFAFALGITALIGVLAGLIPARHASRENLQTALQQTSSRAAQGRQVTRRAFVVAEIALALILMVSGGLLLHSLSRLFAVPAGFDSSHLLTMQVQTFGRRYDDDRVCHQFFAQALEAVLRVPGITEAAFTSQLPLSGDSDEYGAHFEGDAPEAAYPVFRYSVTPGYFETTPIPLRRGRLLDVHDTAETPPVMVISESLASRRFPNQDPLGKRVHVGGPVGSAMYTIVGVVGNVKQMSLAMGQSDAVYSTTTQWHWADGTLSLLVRTRGDAAGLIPALKNAIWSVDKDQPIVRVASMEQLLTASAAERRFVLILFEAFGLVALMLAAAGIYGVLSGTVEERTREIGVRSALGASRRSILTMVIRQGMTLTALGILLGLAGAMAAGQAISAMLFGVLPLDPAAYLGVIAMLGIVSVLACLVPSWRAAMIDPMVALRYE
jgi:putative ABC transport system permease protein